MRRKLTTLTVLVAVAGGGVLGAHALAAGDDQAALTPAAGSESAGTSTVQNPFEEIRVPTVDGGTTVVEIEESIRQSADVSTLREVAKSKGVSVLLGTGSAPGDSCLIVRTGPGQQTFGCSNVDEIARNGAYLASQEVGHGYAGAFIVPEGATTAKVNGIEFQTGPSGVVTFDMAADRGPVILEAAGVHGPVAYRVQ